MSTAAVEPASSPLPAAGSAPSLLVGSVLGAVAVVTGFVAGGFAAAAVPDTTPYLELARIAVYLAVIGVGVAIGGFLAKMSPAPGVRGGIILTTSILIATAFIAAAFYANLRDGLLGPILTGVTLAAGGFAIFRVLTSGQGTGWCRALEEQGWASTHNHKRSQGLLVRRCALAGILVLGGSAAWSLGASQPFSVKKVPGSAAGATSERQDVPPPLNYHVPFTEVTDPTGYPIAIAGSQKSSVQVEEALKKHPDVGEAVVIPSPGDAQSDRATAYIELKVRDGKRAGMTPKLDEELREAAATTGLPAANVTLRVQDSVTKARSGVVNRHYYRELAAGRQANEDATALMPLVPVANYALPVLICLFTVWVAWRAVNVPTFGDFLIATEAEMNKVSWTSRKRLVQDTIVVIVCLALLTVFLLVIDLFWGWLLSLKFIGVLPEKSATDAADVANPAGNLKW